MIFASQLLGRSEDDPCATSLLEQRHQFRGQQERCQRIYSHGLLVLIPGQNLFPLHVSINCSSVVQEAMQPPVPLANRLGESLDFSHIAQVSNETVEGGPFFGDPRTIFVDGGSGSVLLTQVTHVMLQLAFIPAVHQNSGPLLSQHLGRVETDPVSCSCHQKNPLVQRRQTECRQSRRLPCFCFCCCGLCCGYCHSCSGHGHCSGWAAAQRARAKAETSERLAERMAAAAGWHKLPAVHDR
mmetsp:Transcript_28408/g.45619  ORF Transcript_28408/g.45619 Transcript_28408/m.45619 type:complete len:241 (-) Transcript_28408:251-973(-)